MRVEKKLQDLGYQLPTHLENSLPFQPAIRSDKLLYSSGYTPLVNGSLLYNGVVGRNVSIEEAKESAMIAILNCLAGIKYVIGDLDKITKFIKINGFVSSAQDFIQQPAVLNVVSDLINDVFGEKGNHSRAAIGVASLPGGAPVEIEVVVQIED